MKIRAVLLEQLLTRMDSIEKRVSNVEKRLYFIIGILFALNKLLDFLPTVQ